MSEYWTKVQKDSLSKTLKTLKTEYKELCIKVPNNISFDTSEYVLSYSQNQVLEYINNYLNLDYQVNPLRIIITGIAGSGKSVVLRKIYESVSSKNIGILISAPTGKLIFQYLFLTLLIGLLLFRSCGRSP